MCGDEGSIAQYSLLFWISVQYSYTVRTVFNSNMGTGFEIGNCTAGDCTTLYPTGSVWTAHALGCVFVATTDYS